MYKRKQQSTRKQLKEFLDSYDTKTLVGVLNTLQDSLGWDVFSSFLAVRQREFEVAALDLVRNATTAQTAAHASGYAQALEDVVNNIMPEFKNILLGKTGVVENPMPTDEVTN